MMEPDDIPSAALDQILQELQSRKFGQKPGATPPAGKDGAPVAMEVSVTKATPVKGKGKAALDDAAPELVDPAAKGKIQNQLRLLHPKRK